MEACRHRTPVLNILCRIGSGIAMFTIDRTWRRPTGVINDDSRGHSGACVGYLKYPEIYMKQFKRLLSVYFYLKLVISFSSCATASYYSCHLTIHLDKYQRNEQDKYSGMKYISICGTVRFSVTPECVARYRNHP